MQALQGKDALLANIIKEEMAHWTQVLVLSHLHLQQAKEIKSQSNEIRCISTLLEKQQAILHKVQEQQSWDIKAHVEDSNLTEREAIQLVKDFTAERAYDEVEFYMGIITDDQQTLDGLVTHLKGYFSQARLLVS